MGGEAFSAGYLERLKETLKQLGEDYRMSNSKKDIFQVGLCISDFQSIFSSQVT